MPWLVENPCPQNSARMLNNWAKSWRLTRLKPVRVHSTRSRPSQLKGRIEPSTHVDNEYYNAGIMDPKILITTSRDPSSKLLQFSKVRWLLPTIDGSLTLDHRRRCAWCSQTPTG